MTRWKPPACNREGRPPLAAFWPRPPWVPRPALACWSRRGRRAAGGWPAGVGAAGADSAGLAGVRRGRIRRRCHGAPAGAAAGAGGAAAAVMALIEQELEIPFRRGRVEGDADLVGELGEAQHLDLDRPRTLGEVGEGIPAVLVGGGVELFVALGRGNRGAGDGKSAGFDRAVVFGGHQAGDGDPDSQKPPEISVDSIQCHEVTTGRRSRRREMLPAAERAISYTNILELLNNKG